MGYYACKRAAERVVAESGLPWTTVRATQFHELTLMTVRLMAKLPLVPVPSGWRFQQIAAAEVASRLVELALDEPAGLVPDLGGPHVYALRELVRSYLEATSQHRLTVPVHAPGKGPAALRAGANLTPGRAVGRQTWEEFLSATLAAGPGGGRPLTRERLADVPSPGMSGMPQSRHRAQVTSQRG